MDYYAKLEIAPKIIMAFSGTSLEQFEEDIRSGCLFAERCKFNQVAMMKSEDAMMSMNNVCAKLRETLGDTHYRMFLTPECDTFNKFYNKDDHCFKPEAKLIDEDETGHLKAVKETAKACKSEEGTVHLDPSMSVDELKEAIGKGGMKTIDLDDIDELKDLLAEAKKIK